MHAKRNAFWIYFCCLCLCCLLFLYSSAAVQAARDAARLWYNAVMPSLLPFFVCAYILQNLGCSPFETAAGIFLCLISGAPAGARLMGSANTGCTRTVAILNTVSPMFIYSAFCCEMLHLPRLAIPIIAAQTAAALIMLRLFSPQMQQKDAEENLSLSLLSKGLTQSVPAMLSICAAMVFFMAIMAAVKETRLFAPLMSIAEHTFGERFALVLSALLTGMLEMVSGAKALSLIALPVHVTAAIAAFIFSFGGVCIFAQSLTLCSLSFKRYFLTKLLQACIAAALSCIFTLVMGGSRWVFNSLPAETIASNALSLLLTLGISLAALSLVIMMGAAARLRKRR